MTAVLAIMAVVFLWSVVSARLERADLTSPIVFTAAGGLLAATGALTGPLVPQVLRPLVEFTLVWVLFSDAAGVPYRRIRADWRLYLRLLGVGLPLTMLAGWLLALWFFPGAGVWLALLVAAALAPTDAALGLAVVGNPLVPVRIRRLITVESGLNDGIAAPVVMFALAGAAAAEGVEGSPGGALAELGVGVVAGVVIGLAGGTLLQRARRLGWASEEFTGIAVLALALVAYTGAVVLHGNGFIAAFCAGLAFGASAGERGPAELAFLKQTQDLVALLVWLAFGAVALPIMGERADLLILLYGLLSLTLLRMLPVALATAGSGLDRASVLFIGWFGPRGLASLVFALLALETLGPRAGEAVTVIAVTVLLSVLAHGFSARPLAAAYGKGRGR